MIHVHSDVRLKPMIHCVFLTRKLRRGRSQISWQAGAAACQPMADRLPLFANYLPRDFRDRKMLWMLCLIGWWVNSWTDIIRCQELRGVLDLPLAPVKLFSAECLHCNFQRWLLQYVAAAAIAAMLLLLHLLLLLLLSWPRFCCHCCCGHYCCCCRYHCNVAAAAASASCAAAIVVTLRCCTMRTLWLCDFKRYLYMYTTRGCYIIYLQLLVL